MAALNHPVKPSINPPTVSSLSRECGQVIRIEARGQRRECEAVRCPNESIPQRFCNIDGLLIERAEWVRHAMRGCSNPASAPKIARGFQRSRALRFGAFRHAVMTVGVAPDFMTARQRIANLIHCHNFFQPEDRVVSVCIHTVASPSKTEFFENWKRQLVKRLRHIVCAPHDCCRRPSRAPEGIAPTFA
jgi:hypothetical protein